MSNHPAPWRPHIGDPYPALEDGNGTPMVTSVAAESHNAIAAERDRLAAELTQANASRASLLSKVADLSSTVEQQEVTIERGKDLASRVKTLEAALHPFAEAWERMPGIGKSFSEECGLSPSRVTMGHYKAASEAMKGVPHD